MKITIYYTYELADRKVVSGGKTIDTTTADLTDLRPAGAIDIIGLFRVT